MFQNVQIDWAGVDADRWMRLNDYYRQNIDGILNSAKIEFIGEFYLNAGATITDIDALATIATGTNIKLLQWEAVWIPEGVTTVVIGIQQTCTNNSVNAFLRCILTNFTTGVAVQVDITNLPVGPAFVLGTFTGLSNNDYFELEIYFYNNTGANQTVRFRQVGLIAVV